MATTIASRKQKYTHAKTLEEYLLARVKKTSTCWNWLNSTDRYGYGQTHARWYWEYGKRRVHSLAYILWKGEVPKGLCVLHTCDNRRCINPAHLSLGTPADNNKDMVSKNRHRNGGVKNRRLTPTQVRDLRKQKDKKTCFEMAKLYGISFSAVCMIWRGDTYKDVR